MTKQTRHPLLPVLGAGFALLLTAAPAGAQRQGYTYLSYVGSDVALVSAGEDDTTARLNTPVLAGDRLVTGTRSRGEAVFADGSVLRVDAQTSLRFQSLARTYESEDDRNLVYLERGAVALETRASSPRSLASRVDTADVTVVLPDPALVRVDTGVRGTEVYVAEGRAEVLSERGRVDLGAGEYAFSNGADELETGEGELPNDRFTRFVDERRERALSRGGTRYVDDEYAYDYDLASFDDYGSWVYVSTYGSYCWRPQVVTDWRPYWNGYWRWTPAGMTWVSYEPWGWLPYHYGTWLWDAAFGWCWRPGVWYSPAWVYWTYTPSWVGWCPIGYYGYHDWWRHSHRPYRGWEAGIPYPHLNGRVDVTRIDPRGWSYTPVGRLGRRLEPTDVVRADRLGLRPGQVGVVATAPLRIPRSGGAPAAVAVQDAVRRVVSASEREARGSARVDEGLVGILRRDATLDARSRAVLDRTTVRAGSDPAYRPADAAAIGSGRRSELGSSAPADGSRTGQAGGAPVTGRSAADVWREPSGDTRVVGREGANSPTGAPVLRDDRPAEPPRLTPRSDDGWRSPSTGSRSGRDASVSGTTAPPDRRETSAPRASEAWRNDSPARPVAPRTEEPAPRRSEGWRTQDVPRREAPASRYEAPSPRYGSAPRAYGSDAPRRESSGSSYGAPSPRSYDSPRSASPPSRGPSSYSPPSSGRGSGSTTSPPSSGRSSGSTSSRPSSSSSHGSSSSPSRSSSSSSSGGSHRSRGPG